MIEEKRIERNASKLLECYKPFAECVKALILNMESLRYRPRIQHAWRSPEEQRKLFNEGFSQLQFGFHNVVDRLGNPESLAVDLLDDDFPLNTRKIYIIDLARQCKPLGLITGIDWGLPYELKKKLHGVIDTRDLDAIETVKIGWDPCHIQVKNIKLSDVMKGYRP